MFRIALSAAGCALATVLAALSAPPALAQDCAGRLVEGPEIVAGPVCVPENPQRIVVLDPTFSLGMAIELDLPVVGAPMFGMSDATLKAEAEARGVTDLGAFTAPSLETVVVLQPDLILATGALGAGAQALASTVAPTVMISSENWKDYYRALARATGRSAAADEIIGSYEDRVAALRARMPEGTVSVVRITPWDFQVYLDAPNAYGPFLVLREAGVKRPPYETAGSEGDTVRRPDWEELSQLTGDRLLYIVGGANDSADSGRHEEVLANPLWQALPAVQAGRVHRVDAATWMEFSGATAAHRVLDDIERLIVEAE